jgi:ribonuclease BN (tRNA processing enzyme)
MKIHVLGSSCSESPDSKLSSLLIDNEMLLDAGTIVSVLNEDQQNKIQNILITHAHLDHVKDLPFFLDNIFLSNNHHNVNVVSIPEVIKALNEYLMNDIIWPDFSKIPDTKNPVMRFKYIRPGIPLEINGYTITTFEVIHTVPSVGYLIEDKQGKSLLYISDTGPGPRIWELLKEQTIDAMIIETSFPNNFESLAIKTGHLTPKLLDEELKKIKHLPEIIYITHCKLRYRNDILKDVQMMDFKNSRLLTDGDIIEI